MRAGECTAFQSGSVPVNAVSVYAGSLWTASECGATYPLPDRKLATNATNRYVIVYLRKKYSIRNTPTKASRGRKTFTAVSVFCYIMAKDFSRKFYKTKAWKRTREAYYKQSGGLCEICLSQGKIVPGEIVHHKVELTPNNINNPAVTLSFDNLQLVCRECHAKLHENRRRYYIDDNGNCITKF